MEGGQKINCVATDEIMDQKKKKLKKFSAKQILSQNLFLICFYIPLKIKTSVVFQLGFTLLLVGFTLGQRELQLVFPILFENHIRNAV